MFAQWQEECNCIDVKRHALMLRIAVLMSCSMVLVQTFAHWREERKAEKARKRDEEEAERRRKGLLTGREIFMQVRLFPSCPSPGPKPALPPLDAIFLVSDCQTGAHVTGFVQIEGGALCSLVSLPSGGLRRTRKMCAAPIISQNFPLTARPRPCDGRMGQKDLKMPELEGFPNALGFSPPSVEHYLPLQEGFMVEDDAGAHDAYDRENDDEAEIQRMDEEAAARRAAEASAAAAAAAPSGSGAAATSSNGAHSVETRFELLGGACTRASDKSFACWCCLDGTTQDSLLWSFRVSVHNVSRRPRHSTRASPGHQLAALLSLEVVAQAAPATGFSFLMATAVGNITAVSLLLRQKVST